MKDYDYHDNTRGAAGAEVGEMGGKRDYRMM